MKRILLGALLLAATAACAPREQTVVILSTNDMHARIELFPKLAAAVEACRDTVDQVILADAGDRWTGNVYCDRAAEPRRPIIDQMNALGYDVATLGNHEFDAGQAFLAERIAQCDFEVVCANLVSDTVSFPQPAPYAVVERGGVKFGFVGVVTNYDHNNHPAGHDESFAGLRFTDAVETAAAWQSLRGECDVLVALTHIGWEKDRVLAAAAPDYDLIIGGHSHDEVDETVNGVPITQTGKYLRNIGVTEVRLRGREVESVDSRLVPLAGYAPDPAYAAQVEAWYNYPELRERVAAVEGTLRKAGLARLFTEGVKAAVGAELGMYHIGGVRLDSLSREVVVGDVYNLDPFGSTIVTLEMTPAQLERLIVTKYNDTINVDESHRIDLWMTTPYTIRRDARGEAVGVDFPDLTPGRRYRVAMGDYVFKNYAGLEGDDPVQTGVLVTDALMARLRAQTPVRPLNEPLQQER